MYGPPAIKTRFKCKSFFRKKIKINLTWEGKWKRRQMRTGLIWVVKYFLHPSKMYNLHFKIVVKFYQWNETLNRRKTNWWRQNKSFIFCDKEKLFFLEFSSEKMKLCRRVRDKCKQMLTFLCWRWTRKLLNWTSDHYSHLAWYIFFLNSSQRKLILQRARDEMIAKGAMLVIVIS